MSARAQWGLWQPSMLQPAATMLSCTSCAEVGPTIKLSLSVSVALFHAPSMSRDHAFAWEIPVPLVPGFPGRCISPSIMSALCPMPMLLRFDIVMPQSPTYRRSPRPLDDSVEFYQINKPRSLRAGPYVDGAYGAKGPDRESPEWDYPHVRTYDTWKRPRTALGSGTAIRYPRPGW